MLYAWLTVCSWLSQQISFFSQSWHTGVIWSNLNNFHDVASDSSSLPVVHLVKQLWMCILWLMSSRKHSIKGFLTAICPILRFNIGPCSIGFGVFFKRLARHHGEVYHLHIYLSDFVSACICLEQITTHIMLNTNHTFILSLFKLGIFAPCRRQTKHSGSPALLVNFNYMEAPSRIRFEKHARSEAAKILLIERLSKV